MRKTIIAIALLLAASANAQNRLQQKIGSIVKQNPALSGAAVGISVKDLQGAVRAEYNATTRLTPASNTKLITTGTALHRLGADYRFKTSIGYTGTIEDGTLNGDLYIVGGGDPTVGWGSGPQITPAHFHGWWLLLNKAGIKSINGRIIGDSRAWEGYLEFGDWTYEDIGTYYGTGAGALCFYENSIDLQVAAGSAVGEPVQAMQSYPETPWMHNTNLGTTGPEGTGNSLYLYTTDLAPYAELRGTFALDRAPKTEHFANKFGALTCAWYFCNYLKNIGITVTGGAADIDRGGYIRTEEFVPREKAGEPEIIGAGQSERLGEIARQTNLDSDNFFAEAIFRTMGEEATGYAVYDSARVAEKSALKDLGLNPEVITVMDGSGLSRRNAVSARFFADFLAAMASSPAFDSFLSSIPTPGEGTLETLLKGKPAASRYRLKSGSMEGVLCYSGYLLDGSGTPVATVSVLVNGATASTSRVRKALETLLSTIAEEIPE